MRLGMIKGVALAAVLGLSLLWACSGNQSAPAAGGKGETSPAQKTEAKAEAGKAEGAPEMGPETAKAQVWSYDPTGKRDIFEVPLPPTPPCQSNPGTCYDLGQLWVDAVIIGSGMDVAHVILPGNKDLNVRVGDELGLNHGRVKQIRQKETIEKLPGGTERKMRTPEVVIEEIYVDPSTQDIHMIEKLLTMKK